MSTVPEQILATAHRRVDSSDAPEEYEALTRAAVHAIQSGMYVNPVRDAAPLVVAAEVEARAGLRTIASARHEVSCTCTPCRDRARFSIRGGAA